MSEETITSTAGSRLDALAHSAGARALREGMLWLVPYLILWSLVILLGGLCLSLWPDEPAVAWLLGLQLRLRDGLTPVIWGAVGATLALQHRLARLPVAFVCVAAGLTLESWLLWRHGPAARMVFVLAAMLLPLALVTGMARLNRWRALRLVSQPTAAGPQVAETLNLVLPSLLLVLALMAVSVGLSALVEDWPWPLAWERGTALPVAARAALYTLLNSLLWFFGVHGYYALLPLLESLPALSSPGNVASQSGLGLYVFLGGSGATLSLILALLLSARQRPMRVVAWVSLVPALVNVNELLLFGLPLILNRHLLLPFVAAPLLNLALSLLALEWGWVAPVTVAVPFNSPVLANALLATGGAHGAVLLQLAGVALGTLVYLPFVRRWEREQGAALPPLRALETSFAQRMEEASRSLDDPVGRFRDELREQAAMQSHLRELGGYEFVLHYQPQCDPVSGELRGCEALMRLEDGQGSVLGPGPFLPDLQRAGLNPSLDLWVLRTVTNQLGHWQEAGCPLVPVSVNLSADSLRNRTAVDRLAALAAKWPGLVVFEITESALVDDTTDVPWALQTLRDAGSRLEIDDFGTGYSSLSYLHRMRVDGIKIDRTFTQALAHARGREVFAGLCALARSLGLQVVVEGVEQAGQLEHLPTGADVLVQGWLFARAMPAASLAAWLRQRGAPAGAVCATVP